MINQKHPICVAFIIQMVTLTCSFAQFAPSDYVISNQTVELPSTEVGKRAYDTIVLTNPTKDSFYVDNIRTSCGCTIAEWPENAIAPNDTIAIPMNIKCKNDGEKEVKAAIWLSHLRKPINLYFSATCY